MRRAPLGLLLLLVCAAAHAAAPVTKTQDKNGDGKPDVWKQYGADGKLVRTATDTNHDGKPDRFVEPLKERGYVIREWDRNYDDHIDKRSLEVMDLKRTIPVYTNGRLERMPNPGYVMVWTEEDNDYDGKIDVYKERGKKVPSKQKIGEPIEGRAVN